MGKKDYQLRVHVIEARELKGRESGGMSDPICYVEAFGKKQHTVIMKKTLSCMWDHLFFWELSVEDNEFEAGKILVSVYDANTFKRNTLIGAYEFDAGWVYGQDGHEIYRRWIALTDTTDEFEGIQGYLKLSITCLGPGDVATVHSAEDDDDEDDGDGADLDSLVLMPPNIPTQEYNLRVKCYRAIGLPKMDEGPGGKADPFVQALYGGITKDNDATKTSVRKKTLEPEWNEEVQLPAVLPSMSDKIVVSVYDWDRAARNDLISTLYFSFNEVVKRGGIGPKWVPLYGARKTKNGRLQRAMNLGNIEPAAYRGSLLLELAADPVEAATLEMRECGAAQEPAPVSYTVWFDAYEVTDLPAGSKCEIAVQCGVHTVASRMVPIRKGSAQFYQSLDELEFGSASSLDDVPDLFIHVNIKKATSPKKFRIAYLRIPARDALKWRANPSWALLREDDEADEADDEEVAGYLLYRLGFGLTATKKAARKEVKRPPLRRYQFRAYLFQARNLPAADETGTSDPFVKIRFAQANFKSKRKDQTCFPLFYETHVADVELPDPLAWAPNVNLTVWDWDMVSGNDLLGRFSVAPGALTAELPAKPTWHKLYMDDPSDTEGELLASFQLVPEELVGDYPVPESIVPEMKDCVFEISAVGLRNLLPVKMLDAQSPYVEFDCGDKSTVQRTKHCDKPSGVNPNHLEVIKLPLKLPVDPLYCPSVNVRGFDYRMKGAYTPLLGSASIPIAPYLPWGNDDDDEDDDDESEYSESESEYSDSEGDSEGDSDADGAGMGTAAPSATAVATAAAPDESSSDESSDDEYAGLSLMERAKLKAQRLKERKQAAAAKLKKLRDAAREFEVPGGASDDDSDDDDDVAEEEDEANKRPKLAGELETSGLLHEPPFQEFELTRGKTRGLNFLQKKLQAGVAKPKFKKVGGVFKGNFRVLDAAHMADAGEAPDLQKLYAPKPVVVRCYVLRGLNLIPKDDNGSSDPYLVVKCGGGDDAVVIDDEVNVKKHTLQPEFYKCYEIKCKLPGQSQLAVEVWDWDMASGNDLIGITKIDLENRWFSDEWKGLEKKPLETRTLWSPASSNAQGQLEMYVDILTEEEARRIPQDKIGPPSPTPFELRVIAWKTKGVVFKDKNGSDVYVTGMLEGGERQETDVHWRCDDGKAEFNWRMVFPVGLPLKVPRFKFQLWDKDLLASNDSIAEANLNLKGFFKRALRNKRSEKLKKQFVTMTHPNEEGPQGKLEVEFEVLPASDAASRPVGLGRDAPNQHPTLPEPKRPNAFAPWRMDKLFMKKLKSPKVMCLLCCACCIFLLVMLGPIIMPLML